MAYGNLANTPVKTDSNGYVQVTIGGGTVTTMTITTLTTSVIKPVADATTAIVFTKFDGVTGVLTLDTTNTRLGIGVTPNDKLDILGAQNSSIGYLITNTTSGTAARVQSRFIAGTTDVALYAFSQGYTTSGTRYVASGMTIENTGVGGLTLSSTVFNFNNGATAVAILGSTGKLTTYASIATAGQGVPSIYAAGSVVAQTTVAASICTYTTPTSDGDYEVSGNVLVTASGTHSFSLNCTYTDEGGTARTLVMPVAQLAGAFAASGLITNVTGAGPYESAAMHIRCKQTTAITLGLSAGSFTSVTYNARAAIRQLQ